MRGQLAIGAASLSAVLGHHLVDHVARDIGGQDPDGDQILQLPFPQRILIHARHGSQPTSGWYEPTSTTRSTYATWHWADTWTVQNLPTEPDHFAAVAFPAE